VAYRCENRCNSATAAAKHLKDKAMSLIKAPAAKISISAWASDGMLLEHYAYSAGTVEPLPKHAHVEYQFGFSFNCQGEYAYRGAHHVIPIGSLSVIHSGEVHAPSDRTHLPAPAQFDMMHIHPNWLHEVAGEMAEQPVDLPFFSSVTLTDPVLNQLFLAIQTANQQSAILEQETALWKFLSYLIHHHALNRPAVRPLKCTQATINLARDYLHAHYAEDIALETLAAIAGLSRFHFCRAFHKQVGLSASAYQIQLRIAQSKKLLMQGGSIKTVATTLGFYDQSHFGWHFKRLVGVTPSAYKRMRDEG
jgi:AraC-like DNA-binding protein